MTVSRPTNPLEVSTAVADALAARRPVVALESTLISHGLPRPDNRTVATEIENAVRDEGAVPATVAVVEGVVRVGLDADALDAIATRDDVAKASVRDLATIAAQGGYGATTVAATAHVAHLAGIRLFATGGLGGVHRHARDSWDESADLAALAATPICVVCAGVKSILDVPATLERMETLSIGVLGYQTTAFPGFYRAGSGCAVDWSANSPREVAAVLHARSALRLTQALIVANPVATDRQLDADLHERALRDGLAGVERDGISGKDVTPYLLDWFHRATGGASLRVNIDLIMANARLAACIAVEESADS